MGLSRVLAIVVRTVAVLVAGSLVVVGPAQASASAAGQDRDGVSPKAAELLRKVHQASLVEMWAGERAAKVASSSSVKWVGRGLLTDHIFLDKKVAEAAEELNVELPKEPDAQQQAGIRKMARVTGSEFDRAFANTLHFGHGLVLPIAQQVQAEDSPNPVVRQLAQLGVTFVSKHIAWLEATGLVTAATSPRARSQIQNAQLSAGVEPHSNMLPATLGLGSLGALLIAVAYLVLRPRRAEVPVRRSGRGSRARGSSSRGR